MFGFEPILWKKKTFFSNVLDKTQKKIHWEGEAIV
jgi:hypothetical protein